MEVIHFFTFTNNKIERAISPQFQHYRYTSVYQFIDLLEILSLIYIIFILNQLMSLSRLKERLKHYKSLESLHFTHHGQNVDKKSNQTSHINDLRLSRPKRQIESRLATQINEKLTMTKQQLKKYAKILKIEPKPKKSQIKNKSNHPSKGHNPTTMSTKKLVKQKLSSPLVSKFVPKKEYTEVGSPIRTRIDKQKKGLKKGRQQRSQAKWKYQPTQSISQFDRPKISKSRQGISKKKSRKKLQKIYTQISLDSTPSCMLTEEVELLDQIGQGTFGKVFRGRLRRNGEIVAVKRVLQDSRYRNREVQIVKVLRNDFICQVFRTYITHQGNHQYLNILMRFYQENLYQRIKSYPTGKMPSLETKIIIYQIFKGLSYLHASNICHRDIKPENVLLKGNNAVICDFGSAKILLPDESNISYICARCYRAPELIFGATKYTTQVDIWSAGCVILQMLNGDPLFIGEASITHLLQIIKILGTPLPQQVLSMNPEYDIRTYKFPNLQKKQWKQLFPEVDTLLLKLLNAVMVYNPHERATALEVLSLEYFDELRDQLTNSHISSMYHLKNMFTFSRDQMENHQHLRNRLIPKWCKQ